MDARRAALAQEWSSLASRGAVDIGRWEAAVERLRAEEHGLRAEGHWTRGRDDLLGVLGLHRDEVRHSRAIAWLLDPSAHHGLGTRVLAGLLATLFPDDASPPAALALARPRCEVPLLDGRLDIVVDAPGLHLVIENKVDAPEGPGQCEYYERHIQRPDARFVLLSPDGREARTAEPGVRSGFRPLRYATLARLLDDALRSGPANARGRAAAEEYLRTLKREFCR
jgi:hypothetical protein